MATKSVSRKLDDVENERNTTDLEVEGRGMSCEGEWMGQRERSSGGGRKSTGWLVG